MNRKHYLSNIITTLVIVMIILLAGYILLDDIEGFKNRRETEKENVSPSNRDKIRFAGSMDETYYMVVFKKNTYYWEGVKQGLIWRAGSLGSEPYLRQEEYDVNAQLKVFERLYQSPKDCSASHLCGFLC